MKRRVTSLLFLLLLTLGMVMTVSVKTEAAGAVKLNKKKLVLELGETSQLKVKNTTAKVKWTSSDKKVVKVSSKGKLTTKAVGLATVTASVNGKKYTCKVTVADYSGMSDEQKEVVSYALQFVGNKYRYGGISLTNGTDCSGFTMSVYKEFGYDLPHNAYSQLVSKSVKKVSMKNIKPGDLIFYGSSKASCSHVAMYIGNQKVVHASTERTGITISDYKYRKYVGVGRVLDTETYSAPEDEQNDSVTRYASGK
jgi:cell wall-associated NlpC family hydrolase